MVRDQIESHDGAVARLLQHNGQTLTVAENDGERSRLSAMQGTNKLQQREHEEARGRSYGVELLQAMPDAMQFAAAADQTPLPDVADRQEVVSFQPNPAFRPASLPQQILPTLRGRLWIDLADHQLLRIEMQNTSDVNLGWGMLAKVYAGGTVLYEQRRFQDVYSFTHIVLHLRVRELMLRTVAMDTETHTTNTQRTPTSLSGDEALTMLLAESVPTR